MKKTLLFLSGVVVAIAGHASDVFAPGTADKPNYYVFKAGRGTPYLAYSATSLTTPSGTKTNICRTAKLSAENVWEVIPGSVEGSVRIRSYANPKEYLMDFKVANGVWTGQLNATATTTQTATDIFPVYQSDNTVSLCLIDSELGYAVSNSGGWCYYTLDASNSSDFCGNWLSNDVGTNWSVIGLDMSNGIESALAGAETIIAEELREAYISDFNTYIDAVPWVADELNAGIAALKSLVIDSDYKENMAQIWYDATLNADKKLETVFENKTVAIINSRRIDYHVSSYLAVNDIDPRNVFYCGSYSFANPSTAFTFQPAATGGYRIYNDITQTWLSTSCLPTANVASAAIVYPTLYWSNNYCGLALRISGSESDNGLNFQSWETGKVSLYTINDEGSIWFIEDIEGKDKLADVIENYTARLEPYIDNVPQDAANIIKGAVEQIKALTYSDNVMDDAEDIVNNAHKAVNEYLISGLDGQTFNIKSLFVNKYLSINNNEWQYALSNEAANASFLFRKVPGGEGYIIYNQEADAYLGIPVAGDGSEEYDVLNVPAEKNINDAMVIYPTICKGSPSYFGVAFTLTHEFTGVMPSSETYVLKACAGNHCLHAWRSYFNSSIDGNSVFGLSPANSAAMSEIAITGVDIRVVDGGVIIRSVPAGTGIAVYSIDGLLVNSSIANEGETAITLTPGIYVVKISASTVAKILIK